MLTSDKPQERAKKEKKREKMDLQSGGLRVCGSFKRELLRGGVRTLMNISLLAASVCQLWPLCFGPIRQSVRRSWLDTSFRSLLKSQWPSGHSTPPSTMLRKLFSGLTNKSQQLRATLATTKALRVMEGGGRRNGRLQRLAEWANVTRGALVGGALSTDMSHEILHIAVHCMLLTA